MVGFGKNDRFIGCGYDSFETNAVVACEALLLSAKRDDGNQSNIRPESFAIQNRFGGSHIETRCHPAQKGILSCGMER